MKNIIVLILAILTIQAGAQQLPYPKVEFFKYSNRNSPAIGKMHSDIYKVSMRIPEIEYNGHDGQARIKFYPKIGHAQWEKKYPKIPLKIRDDIAAKLVYSKELRKEYNVYAFYSRAKDLEHVPDPHDPNAKWLKFPSVVFVYKLVNEKWAPVSQRVVKNGTDWGDLMFDTMLGKKK